MKPAELRALQAGQMLEAELQAEVIRLAKPLGYRWYHTHDSRRSPGGFPDLFLVHPRTHRAIAVELKKQDGRYRPGQREWLHDLDQVPGITTATWRPLDLYEGRIADTLRTHAQGAPR